MRVLPVLFLIVLLGGLCACDPGPADAEPEEAAPTEAPVEAAEATEATDAVADGGKIINPDRPEDGAAPSEKEWTTVELGFPTRGWEVQLGQGKCKPEPACRELKAVKDDESKALTTRADVSGLILILEEEEAALALVRFFTDHRELLTDETCSEVAVSDDGTADLRLPKDLPEDQAPSFAPVKVVGFEGGFRIERTLVCPGAEAVEGEEAGTKDRLVRVNETVFTEGIVEREEIALLLEHEGLVPGTP